MDHRNAKVYYASHGEFVTLDGTPFVGSYYIKSSGVIMTTPTESLKSQVIVLVAGRKTRLSNPIGTPELNTELNENLTEYDLLPVLYNDPPIIIASINEASVPQIKPSAAAGTLPSGNYMYQFPEGGVKVHTGTKIKLQVIAEQPPIFNVENGLLEIINPTVGLTYTWLVDGKNVPSNETISSLRSSRVVSGSVLTITNMSPRFAGNYTCIVNNDIGSSDGGSVILNVYNSDIDSFFYTNLIKNPNGKLEDGTLGISGWSSLQGTMEPKHFTKAAAELGDKNIEIDQMTPNFHWTKEMMNPKPYQLNGGILQNNPLKKLDSYFSRDKYQYEKNGGITIAQMYQDILLEDLTDHIKGSIYGVSGVSAIVSFYIGNALWTYEPTSDKLLPPDAIDINNYNQGAARISLENFAGMGPGFIHEKVYVTIEEYRNNQLISTKSRFGDSGPRKTIRDPWNARLGQHSNKVYYPGGRGVLNSPDKPSIGDERDRVLFTADQLMPDQTDRYTYGQYAEFRKIVIPKLNPKTTKIRVIFSIEAKSNLNQNVSSLNQWMYNSTSDGIYYVNAWTNGWKRGSMEERPSYNQWDAITKPWIGIRDNYRVDESWPEHIEQRVPKQSISRALATGFNVTLVPDESDRGVDNSNNIKSMQSLNTSAKGLIPSPIDPLLAGTVFDFTDDGKRYLDILFGMNDIGSIAIRVTQTRLNPADTSRIDSEIRNAPSSVSWAPGLFPFDRYSVVDYINFDPRRLRSTSNDTTITIPPHKTGEIPTTSGYLLPPYLKTFPLEIQQDQLAARTNPIRIGSLDREDVDGISINPSTVVQSYVQLANNDLDSGNENTAPTYPTDWYTIAANDRLAIFQDIPKRYIITGSISQLEESETSRVQTTDLGYGYWALPSASLNLTTWIDNWNNSQEAFNTTSNISTAGWQNRSRFIITIGIHNTNIASNDISSLHSMQSYYMDVIGNIVVLHKTKNLGNSAFLPSFNETEQATKDQLDLLRYNNTQDNGVTFSNAEQEDNFNIYTTSVGKMTPINLSIDVETEVAGLDRHTEITLPDSFKAMPLSEGGLNFPTISNQTPTSAQNVVDATISLLGSLPGVIPNDILETNRVNAHKATQDQIDLLELEIIDKLNHQNGNYFRYFLDNSDFDINPRLVEILEYPWLSADLDEIEDEDELDALFKAAEQEFRVLLESILPENNQDSEGVPLPINQQTTFDAFTAIYNYTPSYFERNDLLTRARNGLDLGDRLKDYSRRLKPNILYFQELDKLVMLYKRRDLIEDIYKDLITTPDPETGAIPLGKTKTERLQYTEWLETLLFIPDDWEGLSLDGVDDLLTITETADILPSVTDMYINDGIELDLTYKTVLYGIRPAPSAPAIKSSPSNPMPFTYGVTGDWLDNVYIGTPLAGIDANGFNTYVVRSISVANDHLNGQQIEAIPNK